jgi:hypothetical protein
MGSRKRRGRPSRQPWIVGGLAVAAAAGFIAAIEWHSRAFHGRDTAPTPGAPGTAPTPADWALPADLPALPLPTTALARPAVAVRVAYEFAARHPEVLGQLPCFCGCHKLGHRSNHDCFVAARDAGGRVTWDAHAMG